MRMLTCGLSDVGRSRSHNEDHFEIGGSGELCVVADGMGGHGHGDVASKLAVRAILEFVAHDAPAHGKAPAEMLESAIYSAHETLLAAVERDRSLVGMGTTAVALLARDGRAVVAHVGDSRAYRLRDGELELLTQDHSWVNEQVRAGFLSADQARAHPLKNVVTRALGGDTEIEVDSTEVDAVPEDVFLLCSDGLTTMLRDGEIHAALAEDRPLEEICRRLVAAANERGGLDNITVLLAAVA